MSSLISLVYYNNIFTGCIFLLSILWILFEDQTRLPASRSSSDGPEGRFSFFHPKVKVQKTISLTSFVFWGLVGLKVLINFKSFQGLLTNVVFYPLPPFPPHSSLTKVIFFPSPPPSPTHPARGSLKCILRHLKPF